MLKMTKQEKKKMHSEITFYQESNWKAVKQFIHQNWRANHPICQKELFDWQHKGFGYKKGEVSPLLLLSDGEIVGFRGVIPGLYQIPTKKGQMKIVKGGSAPLWLVKKEFRGMPAIRMYEKILQLFPVTTASGINVNTAMKFHKKHGFKVLNGLHRYILPLNTEGYQKLLFKRVELDEIREWMTRGFRSSAEVSPSTKPDAKKIAELWEKVSFPDKIFSLYRNSEFWEWRYINSKGFNYLFFGDPEVDGIIVARIEKVISKNFERLDGDKIFRIIEFIPGFGFSENMHKDKETLNLLTGVLQWATNCGCLMADFQCSSKRFEKILDLAGFRDQNQFLNKPIFSIPTLFQPLKYDAAPINAAFRVGLHDDFISKINWNDTYLVKSESDQDRPNI